MDAPNVDPRPAKRPRPYDIEPITSQLPGYLREFVENRAFAGRPFALAACVQRAAEEILPQADAFQNIEKSPHGGRALCKGVYNVEVGGVRPVPASSDLDAAEDPVTCSCTCKAAEGARACKHSLALLLKLLGVHVGTGGPGLGLGLGPGPDPGPGPPLANAAGGAALERPAELPSSSTAHSTGQPTSPGGAAHTGGGGGGGVPPLAITQRGASGDADGGGGGGGGTPGGTQGGRRRMPTSFLSRERRTAVAAVAAPAVLAAGAGRGSGPESASTPAQQRSAAGRGRGRGRGSSSGAAAAAAAPTLPTHAAGVATAAAAPAPAATRGRGGGGDVTGAMPTARTAASARGGSAAPAAQRAARVWAEAEEASAGGGFVPLTEEEVTRVCLEEVVECGQQELAVLMAGMQAGIPPQLLLPPGRLPFTHELLRDVLAAQPQ